MAWAAPVFTRASPNAKDAAIAKSTDQSIVRRATDDVQHRNSNIAAAAKSAASSMLIHPNAAQVTIPIRIASADESALMRGRSRVLQATDQKEIAAVPLLVDKRRMSFQQQRITRPQGDITDFLMDAFAVAPPRLRPRYMQCESFHRESCGQSKDRYSTRRPRSNTARCAVTRV